MGWRRYTKRAGLIICLSGLFVMGCESDEFSAAPRATASAEGTAQQANAPSPSGRLGPVEGTELPQGHPPVGDNAADDQGGVPAPEVRGLSTDQYGLVGPIRWKAPAGWEARAPANQMRFAQYSVAGATGTEPAELVVFYFGPNSGGGVDDNLQRWAGQLTGGPKPAFGQQVVNGMTVHTLDASGTYDAGMAISGGQAKADQRLLGAIAETSQGLFFFRLLGPKAVVDAEAEGFQAFVSSFEHGEG